MGLVLSQDVAVLAIFLPLGLEEMERLTLKHFPYQLEVFSFISVTQLKLLKNITHYFACVRWYKPAALELREFSGKPTDVWKCQFQDGGTSSIIPIQRIYSRFACAKIKSDSKTIPIERPIFFLFLQKH